MLFLENKLRLHAFDPFIILLMALMASECQQDIYLDF